MVSKVKDCMEPSLIATMVFLSQWREGNALLPHPSKNEGDSRIKLEKVFLHLPTFQKVGPRFAYRH